MKFHYILLTLLVIAANFLTAQDGVLDKNFGNNGTAVFNPFGQNSYIYSIAKVGGKIYAAGYTHPDDRDKLSIIHFTEDGDLDTQFGDQGILIPDLGVGSSSVAGNIILQPDGKLLATGWLREGNKDLYLVIRINQDGSFDDSFGEGGISKGSYNNSSYAEDEIVDAILLPDGRIITIGRSYNGNNDDVFVGCLDENGNPCSNFGDGGHHIITFEGGTSTYEYGKSLTADSDGNIYASGLFKVDLFDDNSLFIMKIKNDGEIDGSFGVDSSVIISVPTGGANVMKIDYEGRLVLGGYAEIPDSDNRDFFLARYSRTGQPDSDFGDDGIVMLDHGDDEVIEDIHILPGGDILAAGTGGFPSTFLMARIKDNGDQDLTFGEDGWTSTLILSTFNGIEDIHINTDGSILAAGYAYTSSVFRMALAQYTNTITSVAGPVSAANNISVFPNPASSLSTLTFSTEQSVRFSAKMTDMEGRNVSLLLAERNLQSGDHSFEIHLKEMAAGNYLLIMNFNGVDIVKQIAVISDRD